MGSPFCVRFQTVQRLAYRFPWSLFLLIGTYGISVLLCISLFTAEQDITSLTSAALRNSSSIFSCGLESFSSRFFPEIFIASTS